MEKEKGQIEHDLASLRKIDRRQQARRRIYFPYVVGAGATTSLCCAQAPSPKAVTSKATIMIIFTNFTLSRLLSQQVAALF